MQWEISVQDLRALLPQNLSLISPISPLYVLEVNNLFEERINPFSMMNVQVL